MLNKWVVSRAWEVLSGRLFQISVNCKQYSFCWTVDLSAHAKSCKRYLLINIYTCFLCQTAWLLNWRDIWLFSESRNHRHEQQNGGCRCWRRDYYNAMLLQGIDDKRGPVQTLSPGLGTNHAVQCAADCCFNSFVLAKSSVLARLYIVIYYIFVFG